MASLVSTGTGAVYNGSDLSFYTDAGVTKKGYIGPGYNSDMTIASKTSGNWLRLGADASNIALWCDNNVDVNNSPQYSFSLTSANFNTNSLVCGAISSSTITTTGVFLASNGSAAAPAYAFSGDTATGMYYPSANQLGFSIAGTSRLSINASAVSVTASALNVPAGSAATPGIGFASDTTTGLYSVSSGNIGITFAGVQQFQLNTQGIRAPSGAASQAAYSFTGDTKSGVYSGAVGTVSIGAGGSKICDVSSSGINAGTYGMTCNQLNSSIVINSGTSSFAGVTQFASGSATAPGICFTSSTNTGLSESSGPTLNLVVGGATQCALSGTAFTTNNNVTTPNLLLTNYSASSVFYTSGTWTIQMGDPSFNFTLSSSTGYYVRIAGLVHINLDVKWSSKGSATGNVQISLPFNTSATLFPRPTFSLGYYNGGWPTGTMITAVGTTSAQWIYMYQGGGTNITCSSLSSTGEMQLSGFYSI